jgi:hypothetical protein
MHPLIAKALVPPDFPSAREVIEARLGRPLLPPDVAPDEHEAVRLLQAVIDAAYEAKLRREGVARD